MSIQRITMVNVGFGDCFVVDGGNFVSKGSMLVDCGSVSKPSNIKHTIQNVAKTYFSSNRELSLLVTHFHADHYNQLSFFSSAPGHRDLHDIYLPNMFTPEIVSISFYALSQLNPVSDAELYQFYLSILMSTFRISNIVGNRTTIHFLDTRSRTFRNPVNEFRVLWPDMNYLNSFANYLVDKTNKETEFAFFFNIIKEDFEVTGGDNQGIVTLNPHPGVTPDLNGIEGQFKDHAKKSVHDQNLNSEQKAALSDLANDYSLVFDDEQDGRAIFFGDAPKKTIEMIQDDFLPYYSVVKAPHHGTPNYYSLAVPNGTFILVPFGKKGKYQIDDAYFRMGNCLSFCDAVLQNDYDHYSHPKDSIKVIVSGQETITLFFNNI